MKEMLADAQRNHYAVGLFNTVNLEMARGVLAAAEQERAPVIVGTAEVLLPFTTLEELASFLLPMARKAAVPVAVHFDHGLTLPRIREAMDLGFTSLMYDCSALPYADNLAAVEALTREAHARGLTVEAELGHVGIGAADAGAYTDPAQARAYALATGVDALAVAIGTAHGVYKAKPKLDIARLAEIRAAVDVPLVLHGGSGLSDDDFRDCVREGVAKINIFTELDQAALAAAQVSGPGAGLTERMQAITEAVQQVAARKMRLFGCSGRG
jgi:fructose-bisphosphate aldolase class II